MRGENAGKEIPLSVVLSAELISLSCWTCTEVTELAYTELFERKHLTACSFNGFEL